MFKWNSTEWGSTCVDIIHGHFLYGKDECLTYRVVVLLYYLILNSYLSNRHFVVKVNTELTGLTPVNAGVRICIQLLLLPSDKTAMDIKQFLHDSIYYLLVTRLYWGRQGNEESERLYIFGVGVLLAADSHSTSSSGYRASFWDPWPDFILLFFFRLTITLFFFSRASSLTRKRVCNLQCNHSLVPITILYRLIWNCVPFLSPLTTRRDYGGGILIRLHIYFWKCICFIYN
jgi:hypothetical protein